MKILVNPSAKKVMLPHMLVDSPNKIKVLLKLEKGIQLVLKKNTKKTQNYKL